jgi:ADP-ribosylglycohydrolase
MLPDHRESKFIGCLLGGAIGDALGMGFIGWTRAQLARSGEQHDFRGSTETAPISVPFADFGDPEFDDPLGPGQWTDDTQLTLALAETLIEEAGMLVPEAWAHKLVRWLNDYPRAPGLSTLQAAIQLRTGGVLWDEAADPDGAGCGAATRVSPVALFYADDPDRRRYAALLQAQITHGHPDAHAAAFVVAEAIAQVLPLTVETLPDWNGTAFLSNLISLVRAASPDFTNLAQCLELSLSLLRDNVEPEAAIQAIGVTAWSREAVPCALYCVARFPQDFERLLVNAVNLSGGATESIGSLVGAIGGALHGIDTIPLRWKAGVEEAPRLLQTAQALVKLAAP